MKQFRTISVLFLLLGLMVLPTGKVLAATTITVTNGNDTGAGSLRQVIADAGAGDTINFDGNYTIYLASTLVIDKNLTINGSGHTVVLHGSGSVGIFQVDAGKTVILDTLTISYGRADNGGGVNNAGILSIFNSTLKSNVANYRGGGIYNTGTLNISNSTFETNDVYYTTGISGGAIDTSGTATISNSTFYHNSVGDFLGGAIASSGTLTVINTTFYQN
jgi:hypothetical protein